MKVDKRERESQMLIYINIKIYLNGDDGGGRGEKEERPENEKFDPERNQIKSKNFSNSITKE